MIGADGGDGEMDKHERSFPFDLRDTRIREIRWPGFPSEAAANQLALQFQLEHSQWWSLDELRCRQLQQLSALIGFASKHVEHYRDSLGSAGFQPDQTLSWELFRQLPILSRVEIQELGDRLATPTPLSDHGKARIVRSSGSTGQPIAVVKTDICNFFWKALSLRSHLWHRRDFNGTFAAIRYTDHQEAVPPHGARIPGWDPGTLDVLRTGPTWLLKSSVDIADQATWLERVRSHYLVTYPSNLLELARYFISHERVLPSLRQVCTVGESLPSGIREACREAWGVALTDTYSSEETGLIALQCPDHDVYHVHAESVVVEVLNEYDEPCQPGEIGRVVVTPLHNFATPLIRYEIGDYAQVGDCCDCGRGLPVLTRIVGRSRNMARLPDGRLFRPSVGIMDFSAVAPVRQAQLIQKALDHIEVKLVADGALNSDAERRIASIVQRNFDYPVRVSITYPSTIARSSRDKFEDFLSELS